MKSLAIDLETFSDVDLIKCGVYKYAASMHFEILLFGYSADNSPVTVIDLANGEKIPDEILRALGNKNILKWAHNSSFERICLSEYLRRNYPKYFKSYGSPEDTVGHYLNPVSWRCTLVWASYLGLPRSLKDVGKVLELSDQKMEEGGDLIRYFCLPCKPTKSNGGRSRNLPEHAPERWSLFKSYNKRDVEVEIAIKDRLSPYPLPDFLWEEYRLDQEINDRGILLDLEMAEHAITLDESIKASLLSQMRSLTGLENPNSVLQMKEWLSDQGIETASLDKKAVKELLPSAPDEVADVLSCHTQLAKSSISKYTAMRNAACQDGRARGMFAFYGANRTGRWAGRIIQLQNLPQNHMADLDQARELVRSGNYEALEMLYENIPEVLSELIRTAFIPRLGYKFIVSDFSAIEARVLAYLAGEQWVLDVFHNGGDIYCETASRMFGVPVEKHGRNAQLRQKGKQATLSCGYGGSVGALKAMGALEAGMEEDELQPLVDAWRTANPHIVDFWWKVDDTVKAVIRDHVSRRIGLLQFSYKSGMLFITLPSGRRLAYIKPRIDPNKYGGESVTYEGTNMGKWMRLESYGPKFVENIVQGTARDILAYAMNNLRQYFIVGHVHDEVIIEAGQDVTVQEICDLMSRTPTWLPGIELQTDGYECGFYKKV